MVSGGGHRPIAVCVYGAVKGIEAIARFGSITAIFYVLIIIIISLSLLPLFHFSYVKPMFYNGPKNFVSFSLINFNVSIQIVLLAFLAPFKREGNLGKTYFIWNILSVLFLFLLELSIVTVLGAFGAKQLYPLQTLAKLSKVGDFERLDSFDMISWFLNSVLTVTIYIYLAVVCLLKVGLNKYRKLISIICGIGIYFLANIISSNFNTIQKMISGVPFAGITTLFVAVIPLIILAVDLLKERVLQNDNKT